MKLLWLSRHPPLPMQKDVLERVFGKDYTLDTDINPFTDASQIIRRYEEGRYDALIVVAPLSIVHILCLKGIRPIRAEMRQIDKVEDPRRDVMVSGRAYRFVQFVRVKSIKIIKEPLR